MPGTPRDRSGERQGPRSWRVASPLHRSLRLAGQAVLVSLSLRPGFAVAECRPSLALVGDPELRLSLEQRLRDRGFRTDGADAGCGVAHVTAQRSADGSQLVVSFSAPGEIAGDVVVPRVESAEIWIEAMLRSDLYAALLERGQEPSSQAREDPRTASPVERSPEAPRPADAGDAGAPGSERARQRFSIMASFALMVGPHASEADEHGLLWGADAVACTWIRQVCVGVRWQGVWRGLRQGYLESGDQVFASDQTAMVSRNELTVVARFGFRPRVRFGDLRLGPMLALGMDAAAWDLYEPGDEDSFREVVVSFRLTGGVELSWHPHPAIGLRLAGLLGWRQGRQFDVEGTTLIPPQLPVIDGSFVLGVEVRL